MSHARRLFFLGIVAFAALLGGMACPAGHDTVQFGLILPLTGPFETYGSSIKRGVDLAFEEARQSDAPQISFELVEYDSGSDPATAAAQLQEALDAGVVAVIGGATSDEALAMVEVADREDRVLLSPSASSPDLTGMSRNFYRVFPSDFVEGTKMGNFAANTLKLESVVILATESTFGRGIHGVFKAEFERHGGTVAEVLDFPVNTSDFSGFVERVVTIKPDAVYIAAFWDDTVALIKAIKEAGFEGKVLTTAAFATPRAVAEAGDSAEGVYFTQTVFDVSSTNEPIRSFVANYRDRYGEDPDIYAAHGFDAALVLLEAAEEAEGIASDMWLGLRAIRALPGVTGALQFDEKGDVLKYPRVYLIQQGAPVNYEEHVRRVKEAFRQRLQELEDQQRKLRGQ